MCRDKCGTPWQKVSDAALAVIVYRVVANNGIGRMVRRCEDGLVMGA